MILGKGQQLLDCNHQVKHHVIRGLVVFFFFPMFVYTEAWLPHFCHLFSFEGFLKFSQCLTTQKSSGSSVRDVKNWSIQFAPFFNSSIMRQSKSSPGINPQSTPVSKSFPSLSPSICFLSFKQLLVYKTSFPLILWQLNFFNSLQHGILSEAL